MASAIDICNIALTHVGDPGNVASIDPPEASTQGRYCARFYPIARDELLEAHTWRFNTRRAVLSSVTMPAGVGEWQFAYALPADCLRPFAVYAPGITETGRTDDFTVELSDSGAQVLLTNTEGAHLKYVVRVVDPGRWPPSFVSALAWHLATKLATPLTQSADRLRDAREGYVVALAAAKTLDAGTQSSEEWKDERSPMWVEGR